jgi:endoglucanase
MTQTLIATIKTLSDLVGTSGNEIEVRRAIKPMIADHVDEMRVDAIGNLITHKRGTADDALRVLVTAHMDEVGLMVVGHTNHGTLRVKPVGGINARLLPGLDVVVGRDRLPGVIGIQPIHRAKKSGFNKAKDVDALNVDIGATGEDEAQQLAPIGTPIAFSTRARESGPSLLGKALDDRVGCAMLTALLQGPRLPFDLYGVFTVQEEVGLRGARVAAHAVEPDVGFALECTLADDLPKKASDVSPTTELGKGPALTVMDRSYTTPPRLLSHVMRAGDAEDIPHQVKQPGISGTEAGGIHAARAGVPAITIAVPCRYIHSPISLLRPVDVENTLRLVRAAIEHLTPDVLTPA